MKAPERVCASCNTERAQLGGKRQCVLEHCPQRRVAPAGSTGGDLYYPTLESWEIRTQSLPAVGRHHQPGQRVERAADLDCVAGHWTPCTGSQLQPEASSYAFKSKIKSDEERAHSLE